MEANGIKSTICNYTEKDQLETAIKTTGAKLLLLITDYEGAAKKKKAVEEQQGRNQIDAAKAAGTLYIRIIVA